MAAKRGRTQARRSGGGSGGNSGLPGWAWLVIGVAITLFVVMAAPRMMNRDRVGFFKPTPNPDAQPEPVSEEAVVDEDSDAPVTTPKKPAADDAKKKQDFDFYTLLPGKEVPMTDAELAASEEAEKSRQQPAAEKPEAPAAAAATAASGENKPPPTPLAAPPANPVTAADPKPPAASSPAVASSPSAPTAAPTPTAAKVADTRYILQAGAFQASGQAEELKARIALLGLGARVESAKIGGKTVYRVRMGPYGTAGELSEAKRKLAGGGLPAMAVKTN